eukprot:1144312-Pelagomonas_calceolata.AAC.2
MYKHALPRHLSLMVPHAMYASMPLLLSPRCCCHMHKLWGAALHRVLKGPLLHRGCLPPVVMRLLCTRKARSSAGRTFKSNERQPCCRHLSCDSGVLPADERASRVHKQHDAAEGDETATATAAAAMHHAPSKA